jgi:hypothetical protein
MTPARQRLGKTLPISRNNPLLDGTSLNNTQGIFRTVGGTSMTTF